MRFRKDIINVSSWGNFFQCPHCLRRTLIFPYHDNSDPPDSCRLVCDGEGCNFNFLEMPLRQEEDGTFHREIVVCDTAKT